MFNSFMLKPVLKMYKLFNEASLPSAYEQVRQEVALVAKSRCTDEEWQDHCGHADALVQRVDCHLLNLAGKLKWFTPDARHFVRECGSKYSRGQFQESALELQSVQEMIARTGGYEAAEQIFKDMAKVRKSALTKVPHSTHGTGSNKRQHGLVGLPALPLYVSHQPAVPEPSSSQSRNSETGEKLVGLPTQPLHLSYDQEQAEFSSFSAPDQEERPAACRTSRATSVPFEGQIIGR